MINFWRDQNPPSNTSLIWVRLNKEGNPIGYYGYSEDKWVVIPCKKLKQYIIDKTHKELVESIVGDLVGDPDTLAEIVEELNKKVNIEDLDDAIGIRYNNKDYWNSSGAYVPKEREIIVYSDYITEVVDGEPINIPGIKIGDGITSVRNLPFINDNSTIVQLESHVNNSDVHLDTNERQFWNNKISVDVSELDSETLILTSN